MVSRYEPVYENETSGISQPSILARKKLRNELRGNWQRDEKFFQRFFPIDAQVHKVSSRAKELFYRESTKESRWAGIPKDPQRASPRLYTGLTNLFNDILGCFIPNYDRQHPRLFIRTYHRRVLPNVHNPIWPAILLGGAGASFIRRISARPVADYRSAIAPLEVVAESMNLEVSLERLATMVQAIFNEQPNRRFAFGLVISANSVTCCLFDHSGIVFSPPLDYHAHPVHFCALIAGLASTDPVRIGLDTSIYTDKDGVVHIRTRHSLPRNTETKALYSVTGQAIYHAPRIIGRGTTCFLAEQPGDDKTRYVVKDAWVPTDSPEFEGRDSEASLLLYAKNKGIVHGIARICSSENVLLPDHNGKLASDDIYKIRHLKHSEHSPAQQRIHTRIVMATYGKPLEAFSTRKELLVAYLDAIRAHRNLYERAGILHRDIKPGNILIDPDGGDGDRGILIDFDHAIRTDNTSPYSMRRKIGTEMFMSTRVLQGNAHQYVDDLESFYYVLVYIVVMFDGPHSLKKEVPKYLQAWRGNMAASSKEGQLLNSPILVKLSPWFGAPFHSLIDRLHLQFQQRVMVTIRADEARDRAEENPSSAELLADAAELLLRVRDPMEESDEFLSHVCDAINELNEEDVDQVAAALPNTQRPPTDVILDPYSRRKKLPKVYQRPTLASFRTLRKNVIYGCHKQ